MEYDISKATVPAIPNLGKAQNVSNSCSHRHQKTYKTPRSDTFSLSWRTHQRRINSASQPQLEENMRHNGQSVYNLPPVPVLKIMVSMKNRVRKKGTFAGSLFFNHKHYK